MAVNNSKKVIIEIDWKPNRELQTPIYSQIVSYFSDQIINGIWTSGDYLPSQRKLSEIFGVNRSSIVEAMDELTAMGLIECSYGGGTKISSAIWSTLIGKKIPNWQEYMKSGKSLPNMQLVQVINHAESNKEIVRLGTGELDAHLLCDDISKEILSELTKRQSSLIYYSPPTGIEELRIAVCEHLYQYGIETTPNCVLIVSGALQALQLISSCIITEKSKVYIEEQSYITSLNLFQSSGAILETVAMDKNGMLPWTIKNLEKNTSNSILYTIPTYNNPTTAIMPLSRRVEILNFCKDQRLPIIEDDVFRDLWLEEPPPPPIKAFDVNGNVVYVGSISKSFAPGLRIGWLVGNEALIQRLSDIKMQIDYGASTLSQHFVTELLNSKLYNQAMNRIRVRLLERRNIILSMLDLFFKELATWNVPKGGYYIWITLKVKVSVERIFFKALKENILIIPGVIYDKKSAYSFKLNYGYSTPEIWEKYLPRLAEIIIENCQNS